MLQREPWVPEEWTDFSHEAIELWRKMKPLTLEDLLTWWQVADQTTPMLLSFDETIEREFGIVWDKHESYTIEGIRQSFIGATNIFNQKQFTDGVYRRVSEDGIIWECT